MPRKSSPRTPRRPSASTLPDDLRLGTMLLAGLSGRGLLAMVCDWLPLSRRGGHIAQALFAFAFTFLAAGRRWGIRPFASALAAPLQGRVAPLLGFRSLPTAASVSRALGGLDHAKVRAFLDRLLTEDVEIREVLASPHVRHRDTHGQGWHVLDFDPSIEAFRQRGLLSDPNLPEAVRIAPGKPGYTGHKRGDLRVRHLPLLHAGSAVWLAYRFDATGGSLLGLLSELLTVGRSVLDRVSPGDVVVRADGEFGSVGAMRICRTAGVHVLTRLKPYNWLDREDVIAAIANTTWYAVSTDGSGPRREVLDLGFQTLYPDSQAQDAEDGPVVVRVIVSRFPRTSEPDHGVLRNGFQWEMFATSLPMDAWPPEDAVALYFGRSAMENRFAQEDREIGIDRTFSYHPPGQEWMSGVGLFLWNVMVGRGVAAAPLPSVVPPPVERERERVPVSESVAPSVSGDTPVPDLAPPSLLVEGGVSERLPEPPETCRPPTKAVPAAKNEDPHDEEALRDELWQIAAAALDRAPLPDDWTRDDAEREIRCPQNQRFYVTAAETEVAQTAKRKGTRRNRLLIRNEIRGCTGCPLRQECTSSADSGLFKQIARSISEPDVHRVRALLTKLRPLGRKAALRRL